ncbi:hypothetical protein PAXRUDRAFT_829236 [Paxillus rubicundulus Ve08.2h10]|uniref:Uncharacterized protein n=1 Tax=Paxillus rubicundulus Ve08.2h10 TaxID=930991 RepID=A0A0D0DN31_9AGAM|nr:hypothetical protein PAXRUDRAFT_829236 [Paxillus rubicundulus Ve08.2h10]
MVRERTRMMHMTGILFARHDRIRDRSLEFFPDTTMSAGPLGSNQRQVFRPRQEWLACIMYNLTS